MKMRKEKNKTKNITVDQSSGPTELNDMKNIFAESILNQGWGSNLTE